MSGTPTIPTNLAGLSDVSSATPTTGHVLVGNGTAFASGQLAYTNISGTPTHTVTGLTDTTISSVADKQVLRYNNSTSKWENAHDVHRTNRHTQFVYCKPFIGR